MPSNATRVKLFTSLDTPGRKSAKRVLEGIANSRCAIVLGAGISVKAQIQDYRSPEGIMSSTYQVFGQAVKGKDIIFGAESPKPNHLGAINYLMTVLRIHARSAPLTSFHDLVHTMLDTGRAAVCLTRNFDGLETRDRADLKHKVIELHGNNNSLSCSAGHVPIGPDNIAEYDEKFLGNVQTTCPTCLAKGQERSKKDVRLRKINTSYELRPAVYMDERLVPDLHDFDFRMKLLSLVSSCQVLLIAGTSLSTPQAFQLILDLADKIHASEGVVVFINTKDMSKGRIAHSVDYYLQIDAHECAEFIQGLIAQQESFDEQKGRDIWLELAERELTGGTGDALPPLTIPVCCQCAHPLDEVLFPCAACKQLYCFELPHQKLGRMCVSLGMFAPPQSTPFEERVKEFVCPDCYSHEGGNLYPHLVRAPRFYYEVPETPKQLKLIMYYLGQFWTTSEHLEGSIVSAWTSEGWAYSSTQTCLQDLHESPDIVLECPYEPGTYELLVVYVTHGVSDSGLYQIGDNAALGANEFLSITTRPIQDIIASSHFSAAVFLTCGKVYHVVDNAVHLEEWVKRPNTFNSIVGTLNERLAPSYLTSFLAKAATNLLGYHHWDQQTVLDTWLRDTLACTHTDMVYFAKSEDPQIFMFSPMSSRPLGRGLPSIHMTCLCKPNALSGPRKKFWIVKHRGRDGMELSRVDINLKCSLCGTGYNLRAHDHHGRLVKVGGLYAAVVPYFLK